MIYYTFPGLETDYVCGRQGRDGVRDKMFLGFIQHRILCLVLFIFLIKFYINMLTYNHDRNEIKTTACYHLKCVTDGCRL